MKLHWFCVHFRKTASSEAKHLSPKTFKIYWENVLLLLGSQEGHQRRSKNRGPKMFKFRWNYVLFLIFKKNGPSKTIELR